MKNTNIKKIVLAYSGGLDTPIIIPWLKENYGRFLFPISVTLRQNSAPGKIPGGAVLLVSALRQIRLP